MSGFACFTDAAFSKAAPPAAATESAISKGLALSRQWRNLSSDDRARWNAAAKLKSGSARHTKALAALDYSGGAKSSSKSAKSIKAKKITKAKSSKAKKITKTKSKTSKNNKSSNKKIKSPDTTEEEASDGAGASVARKQAPGEVVEGNYGGSGEWHVLRAALTGARWAAVLGLH